VTASSTMIRINTVMYRLVDSVVQVLIAFQNKHVMLVQRTIMGIYSKI